MIDVLRLISPVDGSVYLERQGATSMQLAELMERAKLAQRHWRAISLSNRIEAIARAINILEEQAAEAAAELAWQMGRPVRYGVKEIPTAAQRAHHMLSLAEGALADCHLGRGRSIRWEAAGVILVIAPWNYPYLTAINAIVPALASGNSVVLKHSFQTALVADRFARAFAEAGLPEFVFQALHCSNERTLEAVRAPEVGHIVFTGSVEVGRLIGIEAARGFKTVTLELGGKDAAFVRADADLKLAAESLADGAFFNSGQSCCGIERIYVHQSLFDPFVDAVIAEGRVLRLGNPLLSDTTLGPMARAAGADTVRQQIAAALDAGARRQVGAPDPGGAYLPPEILVSVDHDMAVMREESFGPVVGIMPVANDDEAIRLMNDSRYGLTASIWTADSERAETLSIRLEVGTVFHNRCDYLDPALPWSGRGESGVGLSLSHLAYPALNRPKSLLLARSGSA